MLKSITILSLILLVSYAVFAQDFHIRKESRLVNLRNNALPSIAGNKSVNISSLYHVLPNTNDASYSARGPVGTFNYERGVYLITPDEMSAADIPAGLNINQIEWTYYIPGNSPVTGNLKVYLENTTNTTNTKSTTWIDAIRTMTFVDDNPTFTIPVSDNVVENFSAPSAFTYTGGGLYIAFDYSSSSVNSGTAIYVNTNLTNGNLMAQSNSTSPTTVAPVSSRPETYLGFSIANDARVVQIYTLGKLPVPAGTPHQVIAAIQNVGTNDLFNLNVSLIINGANSFSDNQTISIIQSGQYKLVIFSSFIPSVQGIDTVIVSLPPDDLNSNNSIKVIQLISSNIYSYAYGPFPPSVDGGIGFNSQTGDFVEKFNANLPVDLNQLNGNSDDINKTGISNPVNPQNMLNPNSAASVNQVSVNFTVSGQPYKIGIWDASGSAGTPGALLWESPVLTSTTGQSTILVNPKINVTGNFYVGVRQIGTTNIAYAYQSEDPVRTITFYTASPSGSSTWTDFAVSGNPFRFIIEPGLTLTNDVGVSSIDFPLGGTYNNLISNITPKATIANFGSNNQGTFNVTMDIYNFNDIKIYSSTKSITLNSGQTQQVTFDPSFNPTASLYTAKCYTSLGSDANKNNDSLTATFNYIQFSLSLTALLEAMYVSGGTAMTTTPSVTVELHNAVTPYSIIDSKTSILSKAGFSNINNFTTSLNSISPYYIVVKSLTTLETWSASAVSFTGGALSYDFTTGLGQAYTDGSNPPLAIHGAKYCIYSGDVSQDGQITSDDFTGVDNDNANFDYHIANDVNGDGQVTSDDFTWIDNNNTNFVARQIPPGAAEYSFKHVNRTPVHLKN
ncbi:MAG: hypothetical protein P4L35_07585 [Ignavibacteriaceae bacterium]|nr:hypothetical protein [Ignavibacteriaceae bacterium]